MTSTKSDTDSSVEKQQIDMEGQNGAMHLDASQADVAAQLTAGKDIVYTEAEGIRIR